MPDAEAVDAGVLAAELSSAPCLCMLLMSLLATVVVIPASVTAALQHLAAGIVMSAVAVELVPPISAAPFDLPTTTGMSVGFVSGIVFLIALRKFCQSDDEDGPRLGSTSNVNVEHGSLYQRLTSTSLHRSSNVLLMKQAALNPVEQLAGGTAFSKVLELGKRARAPFPFALSAAVAVDAVVDGFLIGLSSGSRSAGVVMSSALSIEMGFLGISYSAVMKSQPRWKGLLAITIPPALLVLGGFVGGVTCAIVSTSPPLHTGLLSFGVAALLYLVTEELLLEAHESQEVAHIWWVDSMFFVGFFLSFLLEKFSAGLDSS